MSTLSKHLKKIKILIKRRHLTNTLKPSMAPAYEAQFRKSERQLFRVEWKRIQDIVRYVYQSFERGIRGPEEGIAVPERILGRGHHDMHVLLNSKAGCFVFDFIVQKILPDATEMLYQTILKITQEERDNILFVQEPYDLGVSRNFSLELLTLAWRHFYFYILPELERIFFDVSGRSYMSIRLGALLAFRDGILRKVLDDLIEIFETQAPIGSQIIFVRQMVLLLQNTTERCPIPECQFDFEKIVRLIKKSYRPFVYCNGSLLDGGDVDPDDSSSHNDTTDDDCISLPICTASSPGAETLFSVLTISNESVHEEAENKAGPENNKIESIEEVEEVEELNKVEEDEQVEEAEAVDKVEEDEQVEEAEEVDKVEEVEEDEQVEEAEELSKVEEVDEDEQVEEAEEVDKVEEDEQVDKVEEDEQVEEAEEDEQVEEAEELSKVEEVDEDEQVEEAEEVDKVEEAEEDEQVEEAEELSKVEEVDEDEQVEEAEEDEQVEEAEEVDEAEPSEA